MLSLATAPAYHGSGTDEVVDRPPDALVELGGPLVAYRGELRRPPVWLQTTRVA